MREVIAIFLFLITLLGCSTTRKSPNSSPVNNSYNINNINDLTELNITKRNFDIQKIEILFKGRQQDEAFMANLKFRLPNQYLISIRTKVGIEVARINIKNDSIFIIDKINNVLYMGSDSYLKTNFGLSIDLLPLLIGDVLVNKEEEPQGFQCNINSTINTYISNSQVNYIIDCNIARPNRIAMLDSYKRATILYYSFQKNSNQLFLLDKINVSSEYFGYEINIEYDNYQFDPLSNIYFNTSDIRESINLE